MCLDHIRIELKYFHYKIIVISTIQSGVKLRNELTLL